MFLSTRGVLVACVRVATFSECLKLTGKLSSESDPPLNHSTLTLVRSLLEWCTRVPYAGLSFGSEDPAYANFLVNLSFSAQGCDQLLLLGNCTIYRILQELAVS